MSKSLKFPIGSTVKASHLDNKTEETLVVGYDDRYRYYIVFPRAVGGCDGGVDVIWYGTSTSGNPSTLPGTAEWHVYMAQTKNATATAPTWNQVDVTGTIVHYGPVNHMGSFGPGGVDYRILTIPNITLNSTGKAHIVWQDASGTWAHNPNAFPTAQDMGHPSFSPLYHSRQTMGPALDTYP